MKKLLILLLISNYTFTSAPGGKQAADIPDAPPAYQASSEEKQFHTEEDIMQSQAETLCLRKLQAIYEDPTVEQGILKKFPALTNNQIRLHRRSEKKAIMEKEGKAILKRELPRSSSPERTKMYNALVKSFFDKKKERSHYSADEYGRHRSNFNDCETGSEWAFENPKPIDPKKGKDKCTIS